ncbi:chaplin [Streptomyces sp. NPDC023723]|uniref:chaplin n=1 Tax=Streptomyces sp. NPDC023723 TaxID=3154323 RepID=UPI0033C901BA
MVAAAAATSVLSLCGSPALADSQADGAAANSPGVVSGNAAQVPVDVPVNACGNTVDVVAALNPAFGNACANTGGDEHGKQHGGHGGHGGSGGYGHDDGSVPDGASAQGQSVGSPGVGSGNNAQVPVDVPVNACGNTVDVIALLNPAFGNSCDNDGDEKPAPPGYGHDEPPHTPPPTDHTPPPEHHTPPPAEEEEPPPATEEEPPPAAEEAPPAAEPPVLAETGSAGDTLAVTAAASAALIAGGAVLYRRSRAASRR